MKSVAGPKRHRINIQRRSDTLDGYGEGVPTWVTLVTLWARVRDDSQREFTQAEQVQATKTVHIEIRDPRIALTTKDRVIWTHPINGATTYDIKAILAGENIARELTILCSEHSTE